MQQDYTLSITNFAAAYGQCSYNSTQYNSSAVCGASTTNSSGGGLADTGTMVVAFVGVAAFIILVAMLVRIWRRPAKSAK